MRLSLPASYKYIRILSGDSINLSWFFRVFYQIALSLHKNCSEYFLNYYFLFKILRGGVALFVKSLRNHLGWALASAWRLYCPFLSVVQCITRSHDVPMTTPELELKLKLLSEFGKGLGKRKYIARMNPIQMIVSLKCLHQGHSIKSSRDSYLQNQSVYKTWI